MGSSVRRCNALLDDRAVGAAEVDEVSQILCRGGRCTHLHWYNYKLGELELASNRGQCWDQGSAVFDFAVVDRELSNVVHECEECRSIDVPYAAQNIQLHVLSVSLVLFQLSIRAVCHR